ncbi:MucB/RseB-like sigma(E) regulatory protein [Nocardiopsis sp. Huas11]|uniref:transcriptional regulator n=1 Tax=Nocardiopsis sp. Huas11 TaxID=2183912 RepID=UPI000EB1D40E|nr:transcriptional regulator [Nocardiopsis sp. Huas11]RKS05504.1 MucB/RseB-like sigma(E) regulatory protein [Nocardiopsis sp. Huas11]
MSAEEPSSSPRAVPVTPLLAVSLCVLLLTAATHPASDAVPADGGDGGMPVLRSAAAAEDTVAYTAVRELRGPREQDGAVRIRVVNQPGEGIALAPVAEDGAAEDYTFAVGDSSALDTLDDRLLGMLEDTYEVADAGPAEMGGRAARMVVALRADGTVAGRFWVDEESGILLGRTVYESTGEAALRTRLSAIEFGEGHWPAGAVGGAPWGDALTGDEREELRGRGWVLPEYLTWDLRLMDARSTEHGRRRVVHLVYSDGLAQVSVFAQRGKLGTEHPTSLHNGYVGTGEGGSGVSPQHDTIFGGEVGQYQSMWQADGFVYTVLADAPAGLASSAVSALPGPKGSGFWARVQRGLSRLGFV